MHSPIPLPSTSTLRYLLILYMITLEILSIILPQTAELEFYITSQARAISYFLSLGALNGIYLLLTLYIYAGLRYCARRRKPDSEGDEGNVFTLSSFQAYVLVVLNGITFNCPNPPTRNKVFVWTCVDAFHIYVRLFAVAIVGYGVLLLYQKWRSKGENEQGIPLTRRRDEESLEEEFRQPSTSAIPMEGLPQEYDRPGTVVR